MNIEEVRLFSISCPHVTEDFPFGPETLVLRIGGKIFALLSLDKTGSINLKCDPEKAVELREQYPAIKPGYHMNKKHWNTVNYEFLPAELIKELILNSYHLVLESLPTKIKIPLKN